MVENCLNGKCNIILTIITYNLSIPIVKQIIISQGMHYLLIL